MKVGTTISLPVLADPDVTSRNLHVTRSDGGGDLVIQLLPPFASTLELVVPDKVTLKCTLVDTTPGGNSPPSDELDVAVSAANLPPPQPGTLAVLGNRILPDSAPDNPPLPAPPAVPGV